MKFPYGRIWLLGFGMLGVTLVWPIYNSLVPVFLQTGRPDFQTGSPGPGYALSPPMTGFVMTLDNLAALLILPYVGAWSDRTRTGWGRRKPFIMVGAPLAAVAFAAIPLALGQPLPLFMAAIVATLLAMDLFRTPLTALMPDLTPPEHRSQANGILGLMSGVGGVLALVVGGALAKRSPLIAFLFGAVGMLLACGMVLTHVREPECPEAPTGEEPGLLASLRTVLGDHDRSALLLLGAVFFSFLEFTAIETFFTSYAVDFLKLEPGSATMLLGCFALSVVLGALPAGAAGGRFGRRRAIQWGIALLALVLSTGFFLRTAPLVGAMLVCAGLAWSLILANLLPMVLDFAPPRREGAYTGLYLLAQQLAAILGPVAAGGVLALAGRDYRVLFLYGPVTLMVAWALMRKTRG